MRTAAPVRDRLYARLAPCPDAGCECLLWDGAISNGYGQLWIGSRTDSTRRCVYVHVEAWQFEHGAVPDGMEIDHVKARGCRHRHCANVAHLEPVTARQNSLRGDTLAAANAAKTHCPWDHEYTPANTYVNRGKRYCRRCHRERKAATT